MHNPCRQEGERLCSVANTALHPNCNHLVTEVHVCVTALSQGGKKKGQPGGGGGSVIPKAGAKRQPYTDTDVVMQNLLLVECFARKVGRRAPACLESVDT